MSNEQHDRLDALDGIRGIAIGLVLIAHYSSAFSKQGWEGRLRDWADYGNSGVDLFFVLSGFLITRILLSTRSQDGYFQKFYWRRALRIFPLYYAFLFGTMFLFRVLWPSTTERDAYTSSNFLMYLTYVSNLKPGGGANDGRFGHLWSLAIEEQFYLVWPLIIFWCPARRLLPLCLLGALASGGARQWEAVHGTDYETLHRVTWFRVEALLLGAMAGIIHLDDGLRDRFARWTPSLMAACVALSLILAVTVGHSAEQPVVLGLGWSVMALFCMALVYWAATLGASNWILRLGGLRWLGKYSYGIYVLHMFLWPTLLGQIGTATLARRLTLMVVATLVALSVAFVSFHILEAPFLRLKNRLDDRESPRAALTRIRDKVGPRLGFRESSGRAARDDS